MKRIFFILLFALNLSQIYSQEKNYFSVQIDADYILFL